MQTLLQCLPLSDPKMRLLLLPKARTTWGGVLVFCEGVGASVEDGEAAQRPRLSWGGCSIFRISLQLCSLECHATFTVLLLY